MKGINFKKANVVYARGQDEYNDLPAHKTSDGIVTTCYSLSLAERLRVLFTGRMWFSVMTFNNPLQPQLPTASCPLGEEI